ncbi:bifunctional glutamate N-acetyltransferase/amino-acid acetyltransferase ArgJ [bacterium]|nr:bifunctional glutamate N-acetyltransferase/amino-acid acetyltransferase ArgJ [bacterium]
MTWFKDEACTFPQGFLAAGVSCGIKKTSAPDLALLVSTLPCSAAGVFTTNFVRAACVEWNEKIIRSQNCLVQAIVINSGNANSVTGAHGIRDNAFMATESARLIGCQPQHVLIGSTGVIGIPLPMLNVANGIRSAHGLLGCEQPAQAINAQAQDSSTGGLAAARAIMTTDTQPKHLGYESPRGYRLGGMAKGAGMIHPNMATLICVITTDAKISSQVLQRITSDVCNRTFNRISIDGDTSTNDMFLVLANGASGVEPDLDIFAQELEEMAMTLAQKIVRDAEGATRFVEINVTGALNEQDATAIARTISTSLLFKTAIFGCDPNWGRVLAAAGRAGVPLDPQLISLQFADIRVLNKGQVEAFDEIAAKEKMAQSEVMVTLDLGLGGASARAFTSDLSHEYVNINASYRT